MSDNNTTEKITSSEERYYTGFKPESKMELVRVRRRKEKREQR